MRLIDITGQRFGKLLAVRRSDREGCWDCICDCGRELAVLSRNLRRGFSNSCGCRRAEVSTAKATTHGMSGTPEYQAWCDMRNRCHKPQDKQFPNYGARGIRVCDEWRNSFEAFFEHVGRRPSADHSIDRIENDGNYEPGNVRWATPAEQCRNTRCTKLTEAQADEIRQLRAAGVPFKAIRERFGISDALISNIQAGRAWTLAAASSSIDGRKSPTLTVAEASQARRHPNDIEGGGAVLQGTNA